MMYILYITCTQQNLRTTEPSMAVETRRCRREGQNKTHSTGEECTAIYIHHIYMYHKTYIKSCIYIHIYPYVWCMIPCLSHIRHLAHTAQHRRRMHCNLHTSYIYVPQNIHEIIPVHISICVMYAFMFITYTSFRTYSTAPATNAPQSTYILYIYVPQNIYHIPEYMHIYMKLYEV